MHTITIKRSHINRGKKLSCGRCPAALALNEHFKDDVVHVDIDDIIVGRCVWPTPVRLGSWILAFDAHKGNRSKIPTLTFRLR